MPLNVDALLNNPGARHGIVPLNETHLPRREITRRFLATITVYALFSRFQDVETYGNFHSLIYDDNQEALESVAERLAARLAMASVKERDIVGRLLERWKSEQAIARLSRR